MSERLWIHERSWRPYKDRHCSEKPDEGLRYVHLSNTLVVMQAMAASPLFYSDYARNTVLRAASFGGLATAFLETVLRMFDRQVSDSELGGALHIVDSNGKIQCYTSDHLFFLTYCRRFCNKHTSCNLAVCSLDDFNSVFGCSKRHPEEDDLSQYRFFA
ncbi:hypothetical protein MRX96_052569 [Rhipicephalus microplus]